MSISLTPVHYDKSLGGPVFVDSSTIKSFYSHLRFSRVLINVGYRTQGSKMALFTKEFLSFKSYIKHQSYSKVKITLYQTSIDVYSLISSYSEFAEKFGPYQCLCQRITSTCIYKDF